MGGGGGIGDRQGAQPQSGWEGMGSKLGSRATIDRQAHTQKETVCCSYERGCGGRVYRAP